MTRLVDLDGSTAEDRNSNNVAGTSTERVSRIRKQKRFLGLHSKKLFISGPLPGLCYGAEVHGISDGELGRIRTAAGKCLRPSAGGRSLTASLIFADEPCWYGMVAPIVRWAKEVWAAQCASHLCVLRLPTLRRMWSLVLNPSRRRRRGGKFLGRCRLSTCRCHGWGGL